MLSQRRTVRALGKSRDRLTTNLLGLDRDASSDLAFEIYGVPATAHFVLKSLLETDPFSNIYIDKPDRQQADAVVRALSWWLIQATHCYLGGSKDEANGIADRILPLGDEVAAVFAPDGTCPDTDTCRTRLYALASGGDAIEGFAGSVLWNSFLASGVEALASTPPGTYVKWDSD